MIERDLSVLGQSVIKKDALAKVTGEAKFAADYHFEGMLYGGVLRSTVPHAYIKRLDYSKALALPGVACVLTSKDVPGNNRIGIIIKDEPCLVDDKIRRVGDAIALVAADTPERVQEALDLIEIEYDLIEPVLTFERAMEEDSPKVHGTTNVHGKKHLEIGDVDAAFKMCDVIVEHTYNTSMLSHMFIEPEAGVALYENDILTVYCSTQNPHYDRSDVARVMGLPNNKVRIVQVATGGGFGGKLDISVQCHLALLAHYTQKPVKMVRGREESTAVSSKRHPMTMKAKTGATKDGKLQAVEVYITSDSGAYASYGPAVLTRAVVHAMGPYEVPNVRIDALFAYTNNPMSGAFRGFGVPQVAVCHEGQMNALAKALNMDPVQLRLLNAHKVGTTIATGQVLSESVGFAETLRQADAKAKEVM
jgi:CO/xanthine dehydrogenase Mo-binding subunit